MHVAWEWLQTQMTSNQFFAGGLVMGLIGWFAMMARTWPLAAGAFITRQFMTEISIRSTDGEAFMHVALWMAKHKDRKLARRLGLIDYWDSDNGDEDAYEVTFGFGNHVIWDGLLPIFINRSVQEGDVATSRPVQILNIKMLGRSHAKLLEMMGQAKKQAKASTKIGIYIWSSGFYSCADRREPRPMDSLIMPHADKAAMVHDIERFMANKAWYQERGLPYRRGYLLEGPPGTGKSSLIMGMAGVVKKNVYIINPTTVSNDNELMEAFSAAGDGIVIIEDIDAIEISNTRAVEVEDGKKAKPSDKPKGLTLSGLLNAIDGVAARDGRILFITSNHPDKLDPALVRPGRVDKRLHLGLLNAELGAEMFARFYPGEDPSAFVASMAWPQSPAVVQGALHQLDQSTVVPLPVKEEGHVPVSKDFSKLLRSH